MRSKYNTRQRKKSIQGLRSFKVSLPKNIREKAHFIVTKIKHDFSGKIGLTGNRNYCVLQQQFSFSER